MKLPHHNRNFSRNRYGEGILIESWSYQGRCIGAIRDTSLDERFLTSAGECEEGNYYQGRVDS
jgi:hypothetical protein